ncbi:MAG TPA: nucleoside triphosphate pyrophosphohydrolase [Oligoflexia bacterium]|nr:nucleoside triphosphate pyrophosphohydrolase [Oligoflexia bacterium]HMR24748.1 nucleoside triphosphate pyrophosphohydrolase [Oligoflexia bacterium]
MSTEENKTSGWLKKLETIMQKLRSDEGCPWDKEQTHASLKQYCLEEAYEVCEAIDSEDDFAIKDELGDLLLQVYFHAQLASERNCFDIEEVAQGICEKMIRRHPHVFEQVEGVYTGQDVEVQWEQIKEQEAKTSEKKLLDVCQTLPALSKAQKVSKKAAKFGFDWQTKQDVYAKVEEELLELTQAQTVAEKNEELGDMLFALCSLARHEGLDAESALQDAIKKFQKRFYAVEERLKAEEKDFSSSSFDELDQLWQEVKQD